MAVMGMHLKVHAHINKKFEMLLCFGYVYCAAEFHISPAQMDYTLSVLCFPSQQRYREGDMEVYGKIEESSV